MILYIVITPKSTYSYAAIPDLLRIRGLTLHASLDDVKFGMQTVIPRRGT